MIWNTTIQIERVCTKEEDVDEQAAKGDNEEEEKTSLYLNGGKKILFIITTKISCVNKTIPQRICELV